VIAALIGSLFAFAVYQLVRNKIAFWGHKSLIRGLKSLLEKRGLSDVVDKGTFVALSPAGETQKYEEYLFWDAGVLWLTKEELYYSGEQTEFAIKREQVRNISVRKTRPQWLAEKALYLEWQEDQDTPLRTVHFLAIGASSVLSSRRAIESQKTRFDAWLNETGNFSDDLKAKAPVGHPSFPFVTSTLANTGFHSGLVLKAAFQLAIYGVVVSVAFQLSSLSVVYVATVIFCNTFLDELPKAFDRSRVKTEQPVSVPQYQPGSFVHSNQVESVDSVD
jgi:hypothetical protein